MKVEELSQTLATWCLLLCVVKLYFRELEIDMALDLSSSGMFSVPSKLVGSDGEEELWNKPKACFWELM